MMTKYSFEVADSALLEIKNRLTNLMWKLIPMRENDEDWEKQLETVIIEVAGLNEIFVPEASFLELLAKLEGILIKDVSFQTYRKTIFESISILRNSV